MAKNLTFVCFESYSKAHRHYVSCFLLATPIAVHVLSAHAHKTGQVLAGEGHQRMHAADLDMDYCILAFKSHI